MKKTSYVTPQITTLSASRVLAALGPAAAGSSKTEEIKASVMPIGPTYA